MYPCIYLLPSVQLSSIHYQSPAASPCPTKSTLQALYYATKSATLDDQTLDQTDALSHPINRSLAVFSHIIQPRHHPSYAGSHHVDCRIYNRLNCPDLSGAPRQRSSVTGPEATPECCQCSYIWTAQRSGVLRDRTSICTQLTIV